MEMVFSSNEFHVKKDNSMKLFDRGKAISPRRIVLLTIDWWNSFICTKEKWAKSRDLFIVIFSSKRTFFSTQFELIECTHNRTTSLVVRNAAITRQTQNNDSELKANQFGASRTEFLFFFSRISRVRFVFNSLLLLPIWMTQNKILDYKYYLQIVREMNAN